VVIKILQGSELTQTLLDGLTVYPPVANFLHYTCQSLWKLVGSRQIYCNNNKAHFILGHLIYV